MQANKQASKANRASHLAYYAYLKLRLPSHTGREEDEEEEDGGHKKFQSLKIKNIQFYCLDIYI